MPRHRALSDHQVEQYEKSHGFAQPLEAEESKTRRELCELSNLNRKHRANTRSHLHSLRAGGVPDEWEAASADADDDTARRKLRGNARTHKERLKALHAWQDRQDT